MKSNQGLRYCHILMTGVVLLWSCAGTAFAQRAISSLLGDRPATNGTNSLIVKVVDSQGADLPNMIHVEVILDEGFQTRGALARQDGYCDSSGYFGVSGLNDGDYHVVVSIPGRLPLRRDIRLAHEVHSQLLFQVNKAPAEAPEEGSPTVSVQWLSIPEKARKHYGKGSEHYHQGDYKGALKEFQEAVKIDPNFAVAHNMVGLSYWRMQNVDRAKESFETAIHIDPKFILPYLNYAEVLVDQKDFTRAAQILEEASKKQPDRAEPYYILGKIYYATGNVERAEKACKEALSRDTSKIPEVHVLLTNIYVKEKHTEKIQPELEAYLAAAPKGTYADSAREALQKIKDAQTRELASVPKAEDNASKAQDK